MFHPTQNVRGEVSEFYSGLDTQEMRTRPELSSLFDTSENDEFHLLLGMTKQSVQLAADMIGFNPEKYSRKTVFEQRGKLDYITGMCGDELTGYDFAENIKLWLRQNQNEEWSLAEVWLAGKGPGVGMATLFVSHIQAQPLEATLHNVPDDVYLWLDYITLRQCQDDFVPERVSGVIQYLSKAHDGTRVVLDEPTLSYLTRSFCIFEVACTKPGKLCIDMSEDTSNMFLQGAVSIDAKAATSTSKKHKYLVDGYILGQWGSYRRFNESVSAAFRSAYRSQVEAEEEVSIEVTDREQKEELNQERLRAQEAAKVAEEAKDEARRLAEDHKAEVQAAKQETTNLRQAKEAAEEKLRLQQEEMWQENRRRQQEERRPFRRASSNEEAKQDANGAGAMATARAVARAVMAARPSGGGKGGGGCGGGGGGHSKGGHKGGCRLG